MLPPLYLLRHTLHLPPLLFSTLRSQSHRHLLILLIALYHHFAAPESTAHTRGHPAGHVLANRVRDYGQATPQEIARRRVPVRQGVVEAQVRQVTPLHVLMLANFGGDVEPLGVHAPSQGFSQKVWFGINGVL